MLKGAFAKVCSAQSRRVRRLDRVAADLNIVLVMFAIGLATLDITVVLGQGLMDRLPEFTRVVLVDQRLDSGADVRRGDAQ